MPVFYPGGVGSMIREETLMGLCRNLFLSNEFCFVMMDRMNGADSRLIYAFGGFRLDPGGRLLSSPDGRPISLTSRVFDTLLYLVEHRGALLDKDILMHAVWPDTVVEENSLNRVISALRKVLGEKPGEHRFIVTEQGRGYRFVAEVQVLGREPEPGSKQTEATPPHSIAVLPFVNMSPDKDQEYFADGVAEEVLNQLSRIRDLFVVGRTSSFYFKGKNEDLRVIGDKLGVTHILEGSVRKDINRVRVSAQLVKVDDGYHLWSKSYERTLDDIFTIQDDIARSVADALQITLGVGELGRRPGMTRMLEAYDVYLAGHSLRGEFGGENISHAIELLEQAVVLDPDFAIAWIQLGSAYRIAASTYIPDRAGEYYRKSEAAFSRAVEIAPESAPSLYAAAILHHFRHEWTASEQSFNKARTLDPAEYDPNLWGYAGFLYTVGRPAEAVDIRRRSLQTDPLAPQTHLDLGIIHDISGNLAAAATAYKRARELSDQPALSNWGLLVLALEDDNRALIDEYIIPVQNAELFSNYNRSDIRDINDVMYELLDTPEQAGVELRKFLTDPVFTNLLDRDAIAVWASYYGEYALALQAFQAASESSTFLEWLIWRPIHRPMRRLPGFKDLVTKLGLVEYWRTTEKWGEYCRPVGKDFECG